MNTVLADARRGHAGLFWMAGSRWPGWRRAGRARRRRPARRCWARRSWFKPLKFTLSFTAYGLAAGLDAGPAAGAAPCAAPAGLIVAASVIEMVIIAGQAARGERSHFNDDGGTREPAVLDHGRHRSWCCWLATAAVARALPAGARRGSGRPGAGDPARAWWSALVGMAVGFIMVRQRRRTPSGCPTAGRGCRCVGWSTTGGDLRIGHFVGHARAAGAAAARRRRWPGSGTGSTIAARARIVRVAAVGYARARRCC